MSGLHRGSSLLAFFLSLFMSFTTASAVDLDPSSHQAVPGDFNGDGRLDALMQPLVDTGEGGILLQDGTGNLTVVAQGWNPGYLGLDWSAAKSLVSTADLNGDGLDDVVIQPRTAGQNASVLVTDPTVQLLNVVQVIPANYLGLDWSSAGHFIIPADFDGDRQKELLLQAMLPGAPSAIVHADQAGHLVAATQSIPDGYLGRRWDAQDVTLYVGDFNGDGRQDLLMQVKAGAEKAGEAAYALMLADANGQFIQLNEVWNANDFGADWSPATHQLIVEDANGDGIADITLRSLDPNGTNYSFTGNSQGTFSSPAAKWTGPQSAHDVLASQASGDGISVMVTPTTTGDSSAAAASPGTATSSTMTMNMAMGNALVTPTTVGSMGGQSGVEGGSASYSIPIAVPPGIAGMQPSLSLNYSSHGGNGEAGVGWSLSGASAIHRCPSTYAQDGYTMGVTYLQQYDQLCLDGQHLIQVNAGIYRTERDSSVRIKILNGGINSSNAYFEVDYQDGRKSYYGVPTTGSTFAAQQPANATGPLPTLVWAITRTDDPAGNNVVYSYRYFGNGEYHLSQIQYTGKTSGGSPTPGNREVDFTYSPRPDLSSTYLAGGRTDQTQLLTQITTKVSGTEVSQYSLSYNPSVATGRSLLRSVQECAYATGSSTLSCLPADTFSWQEPALSYNAPAPVTVPAGVPTTTTSDSDGAGPSSALSPSGDYDGDGQNELYFADNTAYAYSVDGTVQINLATVLGGPYQIGASEDFMRNGLANPIGVDSNGHVWTATCRTQPCVSETDYNAAIDTGLVNDGVINVVTGEFTGKGMPDIVLGKIDGSGNHSVYFYPNTTTTSGPLSFSTAGTMLAPLAPLPNCLSPTWQQFSQVGDLDGNGIPDLLITGTDCAFPGSPASVVFIQSYPQADGSFLTTPTVVSLGDLGINLNNEPGLYTDISQLPYHSFSDINGDGLKDFVYVAFADGQGRSGPLTWHYQINQGGGFGFGPEVDTGVVAGYAGAAASFDTPFSEIKVGDFTGEGKDEFLVPVALVSTYCETNKTMVNGAEEDVVVCQPSDHDHNVYQFQIVRFVEQPDGSYLPGWVKNGNNPVTLNAEAGMIAVADLYGTGLADVYVLFSWWYQNASFNTMPEAGCPNGSGVAPCAPLPGEGHFAITPHGDAQHPQGEAPDLMTGAVNGLGAQATWAYDSLADMKKSGAYNVDERPCSGAPNTGILNNPSGMSEYYCFASSMWVVESYTTSNAVGGSNTYTYKYADAVYEDQGRGFQGFQSITVNDIAADIQTINTYYQKFPLSGMLSESKVMQLSTQNKLSDTNETWTSASPTSCLASAKVFWPQLSQIHGRQEQPGRGAYIHHDHQLPV